MNSSSANPISILGATSLVGECLINYLHKFNWQIIAYSRDSYTKNMAASHNISWHPILETHSTLTNSKIQANWISLAPIWVLPDYYEWLLSCGVKKIIVLSSTSIDTKHSSEHVDEQKTASKLKNGEQSLIDWATKNNIDWVILRPTLIYGQAVMQTFPE